MSGTDVAKPTTTAVQRRYSLEELVVQINTHIYDATGAQKRVNRLRLKAALTLLELKTRVEAGEAGQIGWWDWFEKLKKEGRVPVLFHSRNDVKKLLQIASAEDPEQADDEERERVRLAVAKSREKKKAADVTVTSKDDEPDEDERKPGPFNGLTVVEWVDQGCPASPVDDDDDTEPTFAPDDEDAEDDTVEAIHPENYATAFLYRATGCAEYAKHCLKIIPLREGAVKRRSKKYHADNENMWGMTRTVLKLWREVYQALPEHVVTIKAEDYEGDGDEEVTPPGQLPTSMRVRGFLHRAKKSAEMGLADDMDGIEVTEEIVKAASEAVWAWEQVYRALARKQASTLAPQPRSEGAVDHPTSESNGAV